MKARIAKKVLDTWGKTVDGKLRLRGPKRSWSAAHSRWQRVCRRAVASGRAVGAAGRRSGMFWELTAAHAIAVATGKGDAANEILNRWKDRR